MTALGLTGWGVLCHGGVGAQALAETLRRARSGEPAPLSPVGELHPQLPSPVGRALADFNVRARLGRKGTTFLDRRTALALVACGQALDDSALLISDGNRDRVGVALGTHWGSFQSMSDYTRETLIEDRPYLVNAALFPNTVMNCAAGYAAIRFGLKGVNATLAGGPVAFAAVLRYAQNQFRCRRVDALVAGAVEEFTPHTAWAAASEGTDCGEGAAVFIIEEAEAVHRAGRHLDAEILSVTTAFSRDPSKCVARALDQAGVDPKELSLIVAEEPLLPEVKADRLAVGAILGQSFGALGALQLACVLASHRDDASRDGRTSLIVSTTAECAAAMVVRGWSRAGVDRS